MENKREGTPSCTWNLDIHLQAPLAPAPWTHTQTHVTIMKVNSMCGLARCYGNHAVVVIMKTRPGITGLSSCSRSILSEATWQTRWSSLSPASIHTSSSNNCKSWRGWSYRPSTVIICLQVSPGLGLSPVDLTLLHLRGHRLILAFQLSTLPDCCLKINRVILQIGCFWRALPCVQHSALRRGESGKSKD